ncbi:MAG: hypothetical protein J6W76_03145, partial [Spirochaetales bacterium]|nr:hypothetical protein [Spirochaetales bacterium]
GIAGLTYRITAEAGNYADGEEATLPILPRRMLVTETIPLSTKRKETKTFSIKKLSDLKNNPSITNQQLSVEYTANPAWTALMSLPYLTEYPYDCMEQTFSKIYGNALAAHLIQANPSLAEMIANDKSEPVSQLAKNEDLKSVLLQESPWLWNAQNEKNGYSEVKQFLDTKKTAADQKILLKKLKDGQHISGGWPWFKGGYESFWVTMHIAKEYGHLRKLGVHLDDEATYQSMMNKAVTFCDKCATEWYDYAKKMKTLDNNHLDGTAVDYLYMRSFYPDRHVKFRDKTAYNYFMNQARKYWTTLSTPYAAKIMLVMFRAGDKLADEIKESIKQYGIDDEEFGHTWNAVSSLYKSGAISAQALMIETFCEVEPKYDKIPDMRVWLLKQKQTQDWYTTTATTEAVYALLLNNVEAVTKRNEVEIVLGNTEKVSTLDADNNAGYIRHNIAGENVTSEMGNIKLTNKSNQLSWGGVFWQYYDDIANIDKNGSAAMRVSKQYIVTNSSGREKSPSEQISVGDFVTVRLRITADRDYEYVQLKDTRPSCLEPTEFASCYYWDKLSYYMSIKDASVNFFFDRLPKGAWTLDYKTKVTNSGTYLSGITTVQCMYAPEFAAHSDGGEMKVK